MSCSELVRLEYLCEFDVGLTGWVGTAAVISPVDRIGYLGEDVHIPTGEDGMGPVSRPIWTELVGRQTGTVASEWSVEVACK